MPSVLFLKFLKFISIEKLNFKFVFSNAMAEDDAETPVAPTLVCFLKKYILK